MSIHSLNYVGGCFFFFGKRSLPILYLENLPYSFLYYFEIFISFIKIFYPFLSQCFNGMRLNFPYSTYKYPLFPALPVNGLIFSPKYTFGTTFVKNLVTEVIWVYLWVLLYFSGLWVYFCINTILFLALWGSGIASMVPPASLLLLRITLAIKGFVLGWVYLFSLSIIDTQFRPHMI